MFMILLYLTLSILIGALAYKSGRSVLAWFIISLFVTPIISGIILFIIWLVYGNVEKFLEIKKLDIDWEIKKLGNFDKEAIEIMKKYINNDLEKYNIYTERFHKTGKNKSIVQRAKDATIE